MDLNNDYLDRFPRFNKTYHFVGPDRADYLAMGVLLAVLAAVVPIYGMGSGDRLVSGVSMLALILGAVTFLRTAATWRDAVPNREVEAAVSPLAGATEPISISERRAGRDRRSKAA